MLHRYHFRATGSTCVTYGNSTMCSHCTHVPPPSLSVAGGSRDKFHEAPVPPFSITGSRRERVKSRLRPAVLCVAQLSANPKDTIFSSDELSFSTCGGRILFLSARAERERLFQEALRSNMWLRISAVISCIMGNNINLGAIPLGLGATSACQPRSRYSDGRCRNKQKKAICRGRR